MNTLFSLKKENIFLDQTCQSYDEVLSFAAKKLAESSSLADTVIASALRERECLGCTAIGEGFAIPHGRIKNVKYPCAVFVRTKDDIKCESSHANSAKFFLIFIVAPKDAQLHLNILSYCVERFSQTDAYALLASHDSEAIYRFLATAT